MSKLYVVPTPVGNLEDMTQRAIRVLREAHVVLAEDTRVTGKLLNHYDIRTRMMAFHQHNEHRALQGVLDRIGAGEVVALVSDAGTPGISDPAFLLVRECIRNGLDVETLPGATAFVPALVVSGLPCDKFCFEGFLPVKKGRKTRLESLQGESRTMVFYESPHRLLKTLGDFAATFGSDRAVSVSREISKMHEEHIRGSLETVIQTLELRGQVKGEITIVLAGVE